MSVPRILEHLRHHSATRGDAIAYQEAGGAEQTLTYRQLQDRVRTLATELPADAVVLITCANRIELPIAILAAWAAGCTAFPISSESTAVELNAAADASGAVVLLDSTGIHPLQQSAARHPQCALLLKSSGTTGRPQIVRRSAASIDAVCDQMVCALDAQSDDRVLAMVPLSHSYGIEHGLLMPITIGASVHLCDGFNLPLMLSELDRAAITMLPGVPAIYEMMTRLAPHGTSWPALRRAYSAGATLPLTVFERARESLGLMIEQLYGATEIGSVTFNAKYSGDFDPASVGLPMNDVQAIIASLDDDRPLPIGEEGQLCIAARSMFDGYLDESIVPDRIDGKFATGDIARMDECGRITITGRLSLLIDVGGLKVNPVEIEETMMRHAGVASCVALPVRQSQTICRIKAVVTPVDPSNPPSVESLRQFARGHLASYKVPRSFELRASLPRTVTGKILRHLVDA